MLLYRSEVLAELVKEDVEDREAELDVKEEVGVEDEENEGDA